MYTQSLKINSIPALLWGEKSDKIFIFVHGKMSCKEEAQAAAEAAVPKGFQVLSFDLPGHGERKGDGCPCDVWNGTRDLNTILEYASQNWEEISLFANSIGAYFSLLACRDFPLKRCLFLSPILDMERLIHNMMDWFGVSEAVLKAEKKVPTPIGEILDWDYYCYAKAHPIDKWDTPTAILYGSEDNLTEREVVDSFAAKFNCDLTVMQGGEHYFHNEGEMEVFKNWLEGHIV